MDKDMVRVANILLLTVFVCLALAMSGCTGNYGTRHTIEDFDVVRFEYTTIYFDVGVATETKLPFCPQAETWIGGEHDVMGDAFKLVSVGAGCSFSIGN